MRCLLILPLLVGCTAPQSEPRDIGAWELVWSDEFDGGAGSAINGDNWVHDVGGGGWGNNQLEHNTDRTQNVRHDGEGNLIIEAKIEDYEGNDYTSGRVKTQNRFTFGYGRVEAMIQLPEGGGIWPAFWLLGANFPEVGWPQCGEIDIMELRGSQPYRSIGTVHGPGYSGGDGVGGEYTLIEGTFADEPHLFAVDIDPGHIAWSIDGEVFHTLAAGDLPPNTPWVFDNEWFILLNVAVGGNFVGPVDNSALPTEMKVDYVRVYERAE